MRPTTKLISLIGYGLTTRCAPQDAQEYIRRCYIFSPWSCGTVTTVDADPELPARSSAVTVMMYWRPSLSFPRRDASSDVVKT